MYINIYIYICIYTVYTVYINTETAANIYIFVVVSNLKQKMETQAIFFHPFTVCSSCKRKFIVYLFVDEETNGSCPFANRLHRPAHLCS